MSFPARLHSNWVLLASAKERGLLQVYSVKTFSWKCLLGPSGCPQNMQKMGSLLNNLFSCSGESVIVKIRILHIVDSSKPWSKPPLKGHFLETEPLLSKVLLNCQHWAHYPIPMSWDSSQVMESWKATKQNWWWLDWARTVVTDILAKIQSPSNSLSPWCEWKRYTGNQVW